MKSIPANKWKEFQIPEIFSANNTKCILQRDIEPGSGEIPYVTSQRGNNGVMALIDCPNSWLEEGNCIMIGGKTLSLSYQAVPFCSNDSHNICLYIKNEQFAKKDVYLFLIAAINASLRGRYKWSDSITIKRILKEAIMLPANADNAPDFEYMAAFMRSANNKAKSLLSKNKRRCENTSNRLDENWREVRIGDIFPEIKKPPVLHSRQVAESSSGIPYVVRTKFNNGIKCRVKKIKNVKPSPPKVISFGAENASFFYQKEPFYSGRDIYYIDVRDLPEKAALFLTSCLNVIARKYSYNHGMFPKDVKNDIIKIPFNSAGEPDWDFMEQYMTTSISRANEKLSRYKDL